MASNGQKTQLILCKLIRQSVLSRIVCSNLNITRVVDGVVCWSAMGRSAWRCWLRALVCVGCALFNVGHQGAALEGHASSFHLSWAHPRPRPRVCPQSPPYARACPSTQKHRRIRTLRPAPPLPKTSRRYAHVRKGLHNFF